MAKFQTRYVFFFLFALYFLHSLPLFLSHTHADTPLLPFCITSVNIVVMQRANVKPPITQSVTFYPFALSCYAPTTTL